ncbi:hypothetical protein OKW29_000210 [Paraburkholderia sp. CI3]
MRNAPAGLKMMAWASSVIRADPSACRTVDASDSSGTVQSSRPALAIALMISSRASCGSDGVGRIFASSLRKRPNRFVVSGLLVSLRTAVSVCRRAAEAGFSPAGGGAQRFVSEPVAVVSSGFAVATWQLRLTGNCNVTMSELRFKCPHQKNIPTRERREPAQRANLRAPNLLQPVGKIVKLLCETAE